MMEQRGQVWETQAALAEARITPLLPGTFSFIGSDGAPVNLKSGADGREGRVVKDSWHRWNPKPVQMSAPWEKPARDAGTTHLGTHW